MSSSTNEGDRRGDDVITVLNEDGLRTDINVATHYRIDAGQAVKFYRNYRTFAITEERLIRPSIRSVPRTEAGRLSVTVIYTGESQAQLKAAAGRELAEKFTDNGLILEAVQVHSVKLPVEYVQAVGQKEIIKQRRQRKQGEPVVEELEAERKRIEAQGQAGANRILAESLSDEMLAQKYIGKLDETDTIYISVGDGGYPRFVRPLSSDGSSPSGSFAGSSSDTTSASSRSSASSGSENEMSN